MGKYDIELDRTANDPLNIILDHMDDNSTVLEFGCANGRMTRYMHQIKGCNVYIVEINPEGYADASEYAEDGWCGDIMQLGWIERFKNVQFDYIVFADVLEHLSDPQYILEEAGKLIKPNGIIWISVPNIAHNDILLNLYYNRFEYTETGLLDKTHLHFFTYQHLKGICENAGLKLYYEDTVSVQTNCTEQRVYDEVKYDEMLELLDQREKGEVYQYVVGAVLKNAEILEYENRKEYRRIVERHIYVDYGEGFVFKPYKNSLAYRDEVHFFDKIELPTGATRVRFDPVEKIPCIISGLKVYTNTNTKVDIWVNADYDDNCYYFRNYDAQIVVNVEPDDDWVVFSGEIEYTYQITNEGRPEICRIKEELERWKEIGHQKIEELQNVLNETKEKYQREKTQLVLENQELSQDLKEANENADNIRAILDETKEKFKRDKNELLEENKALTLRIKKELLHRAYAEKLLNQMGELRRHLDEQLQGAVAQNSEQIARISGLCAERDFYAQKCQAIEASTIWKMSSPIRKWMDMLKHGKQDLPEPGPTTSQPEKEFDAVVQTSCQISPDLLWDYDAISEEEYAPLVTVIVPNYNHEPYLRERLESIYCQTYQNIEVILLDDCSTDESRTILSEYAEAYADKTQTIFNESNCGKVFKQWDKGIAVAKGDLIWIAESDDYCELNFLEEMVSLFRRESVMLAFARSVFMQEGRQIWTTEEYLSDLPQLAWDRPFTMTAHNLVNVGFGIKNVIPNVSSAVFRNVRVFSNEDNPIWEQMKLCGDWLFYLNLIRGGCVSYTNQTTNYYRVHPQSTSLNIQKTDRYYEEQKEVSKYVMRYYKVERTIFDKVLHGLREHYKAMHHTADSGAVDSIYDLDEILREQSRREPNIMMAIYSMTMGGGETYPIYLANEMRNQGLPVTLLDFRMGDYDQKVRSLLNPNVPLIEIKSLDYFYQVISQLGADVIHSHHASVDGAIADWLNGSDLKCRHIVTLHGMYESIDSDSSRKTLTAVVKSCSYILYTADKNLSCLRKYGLENQCAIEKIINGLPKISANPIPRDALGIEKGDFVLCLVSRALPDKGWQEAVDAVKRANEISDRKIHLLLIGDGEMYDRLQSENDPCIHLLGRLHNIRDYFAISDAGLLPTRFSGESCPLVVIDSLMCFKPVIATDVGEIRNQLMTEEGELAGILLNIKNGYLDIDEIRDAILAMTGSEELYNVLKTRTESAARKFDIRTVAAKYLEIYKSTM